MRMALRTSDWTVERLHALPDDGNRYEIIDGERFVTPAPTPLHQVTAFRLAVLLDAYVAQLGQLCLMAPLDVIFDERNAVQPDVLVAPRLPGATAPSLRSVNALTLAVEVLSPSTRRVDQTRKRALYAAMRVPEYWILDPEHRTVTRCRPGDPAAEVLAESLVWQPDPAVAPLELDLVGLFAAVYERFEG
jgi:Uma2 family endonuclease